ncbi:MAG: 50S ribosomal protein L35 [Elusimicrobia bacterium]|nr:50S ribosomal protein L35 [Elusimicrobiota bacterium]
MPGIKTHRGCAKRVKLTKKGKVKRAHAYKSHILAKKKRKRLRKLKKSAYLKGSQAKMVKAIVGR